MCTRESILNVHYLLLTHSFALRIHRTSYDSKEKKHWLSVHKGDLVGRYLLQDNLAPAWHSSAKSTQEKICDAVDSLIEKINEEKNKKD